MHETQGMQSVDGDAQYPAFRLAFTLVEDHNIWCDDVHAKTVCHIQSITLISEPREKPQLELSLTFFHRLVFFTTD